MSPAACHVVPGRELVTFEQHDVLPPHQRKVIRGRRADDAAADDDDTGALRQRGSSGHYQVPG